MIHNNITVRPAKHQITLSDNTVYCYGPETHADSPHIIHLTKAAPPLCTFDNHHFVARGLSGS